MSTVAETALILSLNVRGIVTEKEVVKVTPVPGVGRETVFFVEVADGDRGKVIGAQGRTARSLRVILGAMAKANGHDYALNIDDPGRTSEPLA